MPGLGRAPVVAGALLVVALFLWLGVAAGGAAGFDARVAKVIGRAGDASLWLRISRAGDTEVRFLLAAVVAALLWMRRDWRPAALLLIAVPGGALFNEGLKEAFARPRPAHAAATGLSFPSGHAAGAAVLAGAAALLAPERRRGAVIAIGALLAAAIGLSRIALGVHYASDVIAGWLTGTAWVLIAGWLALPGRERLPTGPDAGMIAHRKGD